MRGLSLCVGGWAFCPTLWPSLAALFFFTLTLSLGQWQTGRAETKRTLQARYDIALKEPPIHVGDFLMDAESVLYRKLEVRGHFEPRHQILIDNRVFEGVAGYHVLTPLRISGSQRWLLVNRGWLAPGATREHLPAWPTPTEEVTVVGMATPPQSRYFELRGAAPSGHVWQNLDFAAYVRTTGLSLQPVLLLQTSDSSDTLLRRWPRPDTGVETHVAYAWQWYSLAATLLALWLGLNTKRASAQPDRASN